VILLVIFVSIIPMMVGAVRKMTVLKGRKNESL
jgi:hypothetical protein